MARVRNLWSHSSAAAFSIWSTSAILFFIVFHLALRNSSSAISRPTPSDTSTMNAGRRSGLYSKMENDLDKHGALFLKDGETSQSLSLSDIFTTNHGTVTPILKAAIPPVRANVLHMGTEYSVPISEAVKGVFLPYFEKAIWFQNSSMYHFSMFHASHHIAPVPATTREIEAEGNAVKAVADIVCPLKIVLDRVVLTSTGVLLGCWQVISGTDPVTIRAKLRTALPRAPEKQLYDEAILHTSFARVLGHPNASSAEGMDRLAEIKLFHELVERLDKQIHGFQATISELWYVEEFDLLALALNGRMKIRKFQLGCSKS